MCTLAWRKSGGGLWICFNRDEKRARDPAEAPLLHEVEGHPVIYARDPQGGGTWFAASTAGFAVALLNCYLEGDTVPQAGRLSRGKLVLNLAGADSWEAALERLKQCDFTNYSPFYLFILSPDEVRGAAWDGNQLTCPQPRDDFWTTSSYATAEVIAWRQGWWGHQLAANESGPAALAESLRRPMPERPAFGATMDREDARTLSQIELHLDQGNCSFTYRLRESDGLGYGPPMVLDFSQPGRSPDG
jgi:hypothetical protein